MNTRNVSRRLAAQPARSACATRMIKYVPLRVTLLLLLSRSRLLIFRNSNGRRGLSTDFCRRPRGLRRATFVHNDTYFAIIRMVTLE